MPLFVENSHGYRFRDPIDPGGGTLFLARAAVGKVELIPGHPVSGQSQRKHPAACFHCVRGDVGGPGRAYAFFKANTTYPQYLAAYEEV